MRPLIIHASSKSQSDKPRRVLHIEYATPSADRCSIESGNRIEMMVQPYFSDYAR